MEFGIELFIKDNANSHQIYLASVYEHVKKKKNVEFTDLTHIIYCTKYTPVSPT